MATTLLTAEEVHEQGLLPFAPRYLKQLAREDKIGCVRLSPRKIRFLPEHIKAYIAKCEKTPQSRPARNPKYSK